MSSGEAILKLPKAQHYKLLDSIVATSDGVWISVFELHNGSVHFVLTGGSVGCTVEIRGSNAPTCPDNSAHGAQIGTDQVFTSATETLLSLDNAPRWLKARVSAYSAGTVSVYAILRSP